MATGNSKSYSEFLYSCSILTKFLFSGHLFSIPLYQIRPVGRMPIACRRTDRQTDRQAVGRS
jgi:hypothetical protein